MTLETGYSLTENLERVALRVSSSDILADEFCDRLTRSMAQLFSHADAGCTDADRVAFDTILVRISGKADVDTRLFLSDRLSTSATPPRAILLFLAHDVVEVARPILENSEALADEDLVEIARSRGVGHMEAIAERRELSSRVTDVLVLRGDDLIRRIVSGNGGAELSDKSFARLSLQARCDRVVEARLVRREDLPDIVVHYLIENGSKELRETLIARSRNQQRQNLGGAVLSIRRAENGWLETYDFEQSAAVLRRIGEVRNQLDGFVRKLAETDRFAEIVHVLAHASEIPLETMKHVLVGLDTEPFVVIAAALGLKTETVHEILGVGPWLHRLDGRARNQALEAFRRMEPEAAKERLRMWRTNTAA